MTADEPTTETTEQEPRDSEPEPTREPTGYVVPPDTTPATCSYCGAPFRDEELLALHRGLAHEADLSAAERDAFESAFEAENEEIRLFRLKAIAVLVVLYFVLLMAFSVFG